jgi:hypothetical protein
LRSLTARRRKVHTIRPAARRVPVQSQRASSPLLRGRPPDHQTGRLIQPCRPGDGKI